MTFVVARRDDPEWVPTAGRIGGYRRVPGFSTLGETGFVAPNETEQIDLAHQRLWGCPAGPELAANQRNQPGQTQLFVLPVEQATITARPTARSPRSTQHDDQEGQEERPGSGVNDVLCGADCTDRAQSQWPSPERA